MNPMMMNMNNMQNMNMNFMKYMNMFPYMGYMMPMNMQNMNQNNLKGNNLNEFGVDEVNRFNKNNNNCKTVKLLYEGEFIQNVDINSDENYFSISEKFKYILFKAGKVIYRPALPSEIIERQSENETLEYLLNRGVIEKNPRVIIINKILQRPRSFKYSGDYNFSFIENGDPLQVKFEGISKLRGAGLGDLEFADIDKITKTKKLYFSSKAPKWRKVLKGLNLFGKCINKNCEAYNVEVIHAVGINKKFDFNLDRKEIKCPICSKNFIPVTMGFWKCEYQIKGEKFKDGDYQEIDINGKETKGDDFEYYDPYQNGTTSWSSLFIFTGHRQKVKHRDYCTN